MRMFNVIQCSDGMLKVKSGFDIETKWRQKIRTIVLEVDFEVEIGT